MVAATLSLATSAGAQSPGSGACDEYTASLCGPSGPGGGGAADSGGGTAPASGSGAGAGGGAGAPSAVGGASEVRLPLVGYPVTPLIAALGVVLVIGFLIRIAIAIRRRRGASTAGFGT